MFTGTDPVTMARQSKQDRGIGFASLFGLGGAASAMGVLVSGGKFAKRLEWSLEAASVRRINTRTAVRDQNWEQTATNMRLELEAGISRQFLQKPSETALENIAGFSQRGTQMYPVERTTSELGAANQSVTAYASPAVTGMLNFPDSTAWLEVSADLDTGYARHAVIMSRNQDPAALNSIRGFIEAMAPRWAAGTHY